MATANMNTIEPGSSLAELIKTLDLSQVPTKLHCQSCQGFLLNAYKTSCCEQSICESCFEDVPDHCPICSHKPFCQDLCRAVKGPRGTAKAYLRSIEKSRLDSRDGGKTTETIAMTDDQSLEKGNEGTLISADAVLESVEAEPSNTTAISLEKNAQEDADSNPLTPAENTVSVQQPQTENPAIEHEIDRAERQSSETSDDNDDEVEIQVDPSQEDEYHEQMHYSYGDDEEQGVPRQDTENTSEKQDENNKDAQNGMDTGSFNAMNANMGYNNNMEMNPMAIMQQMMMNGINPMMGMPMGINAGMFGGLGGQNGGMNGMNMGMMNFNPGQNMFGWNGQNSNSWQNNNANSFQNGMGGEFGSQFGFDMSQQGNFQQQQFRNGDFQNGYAGYRGRGRGRGRGGFNRGRGSFNQYSQNSYQGYQNGQESYQNETSQSQPQTTSIPSLQSRISREDSADRQDTRPHPEDLIPGGQDEVNEALENGHRGPGPEKSAAAAVAISSGTDEPKQTPQPRTPPPEPDTASLPSTTGDESRIVSKPIPEAYHEDFDTMAPPSAPSGPSGRHGDRDFGFRSRGQGRYPLRGRGSYTSHNGHSASPASTKPNAAAVTQPQPAQGTGVQGAPTGPRAMREPPAPKPATHAAGGFQIIGRAAMKSQSSHSATNDRLRSPSPIADYDSNENDRNRRPSRPDRYDESRFENESEVDFAGSERDRRRRKSRRDEYGNADMRAVSRSPSQSRSHSRERRPSHRSSRYDKDRERDKDRYSSHRSSRKYQDESVTGEYDLETYDDRGDERSSKHRPSHRSGGRPASRQEEKPKEKEDRHRKRSRHDRDRDDDQDEQEEEESRHRSRRHKKDHHHTSSSKRSRNRDDTQADDDDMGFRISGRSASRKMSSALPTPTSATTPIAVEKDPHTLEREARNRERMEKETQRRQKAAQGKSSSNNGGGGSKISRSTVSGGRRVSYKYEDEVERGMDERDNARWH